MDGSRFDQLLRCAVAAHTRRGLAKAVVGGTLAAVLGRDDVAALACGKKCRQRGWKCCDRVCTNIKRNLSHCGACDNPCLQPGFVCCVGAFGGPCVDPVVAFSSDAANCGQCGRRCRRGQLCVNGTCQTGGGSGGLFGRNLIENPDAEDGAASPNGQGGIPVPGWTLVGDFTVVAYGTGDWPTPTSPGPKNRGNRFFSGGVGASSQAAQTIDVSAAAAQIDAGRVNCELSGFLGDYASQSDNAGLLASFQDANGADIGSAQIGPVSNTDRENVSGLLEQSTVTPVPLQTRRIGLVLTMTRVHGSFNDGYADNLSLVLTSA